jgi:hypothetical protein
MALYICGESVIQASTDRVVCKNTCGAYPTRHRRSLRTLVDNHGADHLAQESRLRIGSKFVSGQLVTARNPLRRLREYAVQSPDEVGHGEIGDIEGHKALQMYLTKDHDMVEALSPDTAQTAVTNCIGRRCLQRCTQQLD